VSDHASDAPLEPDLDTLGALMAERFLDQLRASRSRHPDESFLFPKLSNAALRRQIVRWFAREYSETTPGMLAVLRTALRDDDWEVRVSAMLVAARLRAAPLRPLVKEVLLPAAHQFGLSERDVRLLIALRAISTEALDSADVADRVSAVTQRLAGAPRDVVRHALEQSNLPSTTTTLLIHALVTPNELETPFPDALPGGITRRDRRFFLGHAIEMVWVSPTVHLLGGDALNRIRTCVPGGGMFVARRPVTAAALGVLGVPVPRADPSLFPSVAERIAQTPEPPLPMSHGDAIEVCEALSLRVDGAVDLPTADELECAARGTDGRRYSWGNGIEQLSGNERTPHGLERFAVPAPQWTSTLDNGGVPLVLGGPSALPCATRIAWYEGAALRPIVRMD
jgi:hypothetical protein